MALKQKFYVGSACAALVAGLALHGVAVAQDAPPIVQPGAPGEEGRELTADEANQIADNRYSADDVRFLQHFIVHHGQSAELTAFVDGRTDNEAVIEIAERIDGSRDEDIAFMTEWLTARGEPVTAEEDTVRREDGGMATPAQLEALGEASGTQFDALFLSLMIAHHDGLADDITAYLRTRGTAYDPALFDFVNGLRSKQREEIEEMDDILAGLSDDPRRGLATGFRDYGEAISNLTLVSAQPKPTGFFDPSNPVGRPPEIVDEDAEEDADEDADPRFGSRSPFLRFSNTDFAFKGDLMAVGNYHGFNMYDISQAEPRLISSIVCPGGQGDVSIEGDLLIMSVQDTRGRVDCGGQGVAEEVSDERFRGIRIFDISDPVTPRQVGLVQTCRGSHTHSVVSSDEDYIIVYNSGTSSIRPDEELEGCVVGFPGDEDTALFSIDVIEIPIADPAASRIVDSPRVFADPESGEVAGLWAGGDHGEGTQSSRRTDQCHDITVFPALNIAAGACSGNGIILDITDPRAPTRIDDVVDVGFAYWHSATLNNDGTKVVFTDEWGGGGAPRCRPQDPETWGANAIFDFDGEELTFASYFKIPSVQTEHENCVAHNGSLIPVPGRDIFVQAWYQGGLTLMDFTDSSNPFEIGFYDRGPITDDVYVTGGYWSTYWYNGRIYGTAIVRGLDVFELAESEHLSANEIEAAQLADMGEVFNPQQQFPVIWPTHPVVALAYVDQLVREDAISDEDAAELYEALGSARTHMEAGTTDGSLARELRGLRRGLPRTDRGNALREQLGDIADAVR